MSLIHYILGYMIPPNQGSILFHDSSLNRTPRENCYISGCEGPNEIYQDILDRVWILIYVVKVFEPEDEIVTRGSLYMFSMLNSPEIGNLGKTIISPNW